MGTVMLELDGELVPQHEQLCQPVEHAVNDLIVLEFYRRALISGGRAAEPLGMPKSEFIPHASDSGLPYIRVSDDEWPAERARMESAPPPGWVVSGSSRQSSR